MDMTVSFFMHHKQLVLEVLLFGSNIYNVVRMIKIPPEHSVHKNIATHATIQR
jgi:hypothetical protein